MSDDEKLRRLRSLLDDASFHKSYSWDPFPKQLESMAMATTVGERFYGGARFRPYQYMLAKQAAKYLCRSESPCPLCKMFAAQDFLANGRDMNAYKEGAD